MGTARPIRRLHRCDIGWGGECRYSSVPSVTLQRRQDCQISVEASGPQWRIAAGVGRVRIGAMSQQRLDDGDVIVLYRQDQRRVSVRVECIHVDVAGERGLQTAHVAALGC